MRRTQILGSVGEVLLVVGEPGPGDDVIGGVCSGSSAEVADAVVSAEDSGDGVFSPASSGAFRHGGVNLPRERREPHAFRRTAHQCPERTRYRPAVSRIDPQFPRFTDLQVREDGWTDIAGQPRTFKRVTRITGTSGMLPNN